MEKIQNFFERVSKNSSESALLSGTFMKRVAVVVAVVLSVNFVQPQSAQAVSPPSIISLGATVVATPAAPFIDSDAGTTVSVAISSLTGVTDQDVLYLGLTDGSGNLQRRIIVKPGTVSSGEGVTTASASFVTTTFGAQPYRLWVDKADSVTGLRNRIWDNNSNLNEPVTEGTFNFAGNPTSVSLTDAIGGSLGDLVSVSEGTCKVFQAIVSDANSTPIRDQQLSITFDKDALGAKPQACLASDLTALNQSSATTIANGLLLTGSTNNQGIVKFAIKGSKGAPAWTGSVTASVINPLADPSAFSSFTLTTNPGGNGAVDTIAAVAPTAASRLSSTTVSLTVTDRYGKPLQGVVLNANPSASPSAGAELAATDMDGKTNYPVKTDVLGVQNITFWVNKTAVGSTAGVDVGEVTKVVTIEIVPQLVDISKSSFVPAKAVVPTDSVIVPLTLTMKDSSNTPVKDVQIDFTVPSPSPNSITLSSTSGITDSAGKIVITATRSALVKTRQTIEVVGTIRNSNPAQTISLTFEIQPRAASQIALISQSHVSAADGGTARVEVALQDQFGGPFAGIVGFRSISGRNMTLGYADAITTDATGHAVVNFRDAKGSGVTETDSVVAEARTVDNVLISSDPVTVHYSPSLSANGTNQTGLPTIYNVLYGNASKQTTFNIVAELKNTAESVERKLYGVTTHLTITGPANFTPSGNSLDLVSDNNAQIAFNVLPTGVAGTVTVTLVSGGATKVWYLDVIPSADGARVISISASTSAAKSGATTRFTAAVKDVFGNALPSVRVTFVSNGVGLLKSAGFDYCSGIGTSDSTYSVPLFTNAVGQAWTDLQTTAFDAGTARVTAYLGNPLNNGCPASYPEALQLAGAPFSGALAGVPSTSTSVTYTADTTLMDTLASILAAKAAADAANAQAAANAAKAAADAKAAIDAKAAADAANAQAAANAAKAAANAKAAAKSLADAKKALAAASAKLKAAQKLAKSQKSVKAKAKR